MDKKENKRKKGLSVLALILLLLVITIGFSVGTGNFKILGTTTIGVPEWDIHFQNINVVNGSVTASTAPTISASDECQINFGVALPSPGSSCRSSCIRAFHRRHVPWVHRYRRLQPVPPLQPL